MISYETRLGTIGFSESYLSKLIGDEVTSCFGVAGMVARDSKQMIFNKFSKEDSVDTGIKVYGDAEFVTVEIHIIVTYGMNINAIAKSIVNKVRFVVEEATGITVDKITVKVDGIKE